MFLQESAGKNTQKLNPSFCVCVLVFNMQIDVWDWLLIIYIICKITDV